MRLQRALDIRSLANSQDDLALLLRQFMDSRQLWLFRRQRQRCIALDGGSMTKSDRDKNGVELLDWKPSDVRDE
jgi:hypothetical protein